LLGEYTASDHASAMVITHAHYFELKKTAKIAFAIPQFQNHIRPIDNFKIDGNAYAAEGNVINRGRNALLADTGEQYASGVRAGMVTNCQAMLDGGVMLGLAHHFQQLGRHRDAPAILSEQPNEAQFRIFGLSKGEERVSFLANSI
jgi:hypothetical protein